MFVRTKATVRVGLTGPTGSAKASSACYDLAMSAGAESIAENLACITERIERATQRVGRRAREITLVGASKTFPAESVSTAYAAGIRHFGENRVQEWEKKEPLVRELNATWHLIGHLQSNKITRAVRFFHTVDSVDSLALARKLDSALAGFGERPNVKQMRVLIEVRVAEEDTKSGASESEIEAMAEDILPLAHLDLQGLMCIPPYFDDAKDARPFFSKVRELRDDLTKRIGRELPVLSMGMSHDFEVAIEEGATEIRVGTALFGPRKG
jgi:pyridoxal phosphate enzyme (YggS family)